MLTKGPPRKGGLLLPTPFEKLPFLNAIAPCNIIAAAVLQPVIQQSEYRHDADFYCLGGRSEWTGSPARNKRFIQPGKGAFD